MNAIRQPDVLIRIAASLLVSFFIVLHGRWHLFGEAVISPAFYFALLVSFSVSFFLLYLVRAGNTFLNERQPWQRNLYHRLFFQAVLCLVVPSVLDILFVSLYFKATNSIFNVVDYLRHDYPIIALLLILLNSYYTLPYFFKQSVTVPPVTEPELPSIPEPSPLPSKHTSLLISKGTMAVKLDVCSDILYFCRISKRVWVFTKDGDRYHVEDSLQTIQERYADAGLIHINRSTVANLAVVKGYTRGIRRYTLDLIIKDEYQHLKAMQNNSYLVVTKEYLGNFKTRMEHQFETVGSGE